MMRVHRLSLVLVLFAASLSAQTWTDLETGNERFRRGTVLFAGLNELRTDLLRHGQHPKVTILACADSRVPPELVFDQTLGKLFVVRIAGNVADQFGIASLKYARDHKYTETLIIVGHQDCGAVKEAMKPVGEWPKDDDLKALLTRIKAAIGTTTDLDEAIKKNALASARYVSMALGVRAVAAYYDMKSGTVERLP